MSLATVHWWEDLSGNIAEFSSLAGVGFSISSSEQNIIEQNASVAQHFWNIHICRRNRLNIILKWNKKLSKRYILQSYSFIGTHIVLVYNTDLVYQGQHILIAWELKPGFSNPFAPLQWIKFNADRSNTH